MSLPQRIPKVLIPAAVHAATGVSGNISGIISASIISVPTMPTGVVGITRLQRSLRSSNGGTADQKKGEKEGEPEGADSMGEMISPVQVPLKEGADSLGEMTCPVQDPLKHQSENQNENQSEEVNRVNTPPQEHLNEQLNKQLSENQMDAKGGQKGGQTGNQKATTLEVHQPQRKRLAIGKNKMFMKRLAGEMIMNEGPKGSSGVGVKRVKQYGANIIDNDTSDEEIEKLTDELSESDYYSGNSNMGAKKGGQIQISNKVSNKIQKTGEGDIMGEGHRNLHKSKVIDMNLPDFKSSAAQNLVKASAELPDREKFFKTLKKVSVTPIKPPLQDKTHLAVGGDQNVLL
jgi:hypothetical protein